MALLRGLFARKDANRGTTPIEARQALSGLLSLPTTGGVLRGMQVTGTDGWAYQVAAGVVTFVRGAGDGVIVAANDSATSVGTDPAPSTGSRWDLIWARHLDVDAGDPNSEAMFGVTSSTAAGTPSKPYNAVPAGATVLAEALMPASALSAANASITQVALPVAAHGGINYVPNATVRNALAAAWDPAVPLYVHRKDAPDGRELELRVSGTVFRSVGARIDVHGIATRAAYLKAGVVTASTNASGDGEIIFPEAFPNALYSATLSDAAPIAALGHVRLKWTETTSGRTRITFRAYKSDGTVLNNNSAVRVSYQAVGV